MINDDHILPMYEYFTFPPGEKGGGRGGQLD